MKNIRKKTSRHCNFAETGVNMNGYYKFKKLILQFIRYSDTISRKIDWTLKEQVPVWLGATILVTRGDEKNTVKSFSQYWRNFKKPDIEQMRKNPNFFFKKQLGWDTK